MCAVEQYVVRSDAACLKRRQSSERRITQRSHNPQLVDGFRLGVRASADPVLVVDESHPLRTASLITGGAALALGGVAVGFWAAGDGATNSYNQTLRTGSLLEQQLGQRI